MALGRPMPPLVIAENQRRQLQALANSRSLPHSIVRRAQIVLACAAGETNTAIAKRMGLTGMTVGKCASVTGSSVWGDCTTSSGQAARAPTTTTRWPR